jgi:hypothetical protein
MNCLKKMFIHFILGLSCVFILSNAHAIEPTNPMTLCERFIAPETQKECQKKISKLGPDWYLATICEKQFDDGDFYSCLQMSQNYNFTPDQLSKCDEPGFNDVERLGCLKTISGNIAFQDEKKPSPSQRLPASKNKKK